jgi:hypothetical protein
VAAYRAARRGQGQDRPAKQQVPDEVRLTRHVRRDWFRNRVLRPAIEAAGLDWRPRVHDLRHASASWALAGGATVQQVREHLGHTSLRAVERYLHNPPGAEAGAAGAIARVRATGALYPLVTPSYTPVPLISVPTTAAVLAYPLGQDADAAPSSARPREQVSSEPAATEPQNEGSADTRAESGPSLVAVAVAPTAETMITRSEVIVDASSPAARDSGGPEAALVAIVDTNAAGEEAGLNRERIPARKRPTPPQGRGSGRSRHRSNKKRRGAKSQNDQFRVQDRYAGDGQQTDTRTTPRETGRAHVESPVTSRERHVEHLRLKSPATTLASGDKGTPAAQSLWRARVEPNSSRPASQTSSVPEKRSERSDPLTSDEQGIKKPVPSTSGDRL